MTILWFQDLQKTFYKVAKKNLLYFINFRSMRREVIKYVQCRKIFQWCIDL